MFAYYFLMIVLFSKFRIYVDWKFLYTSLPFSLVLCIACIILFAMITIFMWAKELEGGRNDRP